MENMLTWLKAGTKHVELSYFFLIILNVIKNPSYNHIDRCDFTFIYIFTIVSGVKKKKIQMFVNAITQNVERCVANKEGREVYCQGKVILLGHCTAVYYGNV